VVFANHCRASRMLGRPDHSCPRASILPECLWVPCMVAAPALLCIVHGEDRPLLMLV
jgi:hypothetical protein